MMRYSNPYRAGYPWAKGSLHTHTNGSPCGHYSVGQVCSLYADEIISYDFIAITDHLQVTPVPMVHNGLSIISGEEFKRNQRQLLGIGISSIEDNPDELDNHQTVIDAIKRQNGLTIICHPHIYKEDYWPLEELLGLDRYDGIEIFNNNVKMNNTGRAVATDIWDQLLSAGKKVWGFAGDDMHHVSRIGGGFLMVQSTSKSREALLTALRSGSFYASTGVFFTKISMAGSKSSAQQLEIQVDTITATANELMLIGDGGKILYCINNADTVIIPMHELSPSTYVRVEVRRCDGAFAWSQPFFRED